MRRDLWHFRAISLTPAQDCQSRRCPAISDNSTLHCMTSLDRGPVVIPYKPHAAMTRA
jgi:hypothetical protein